jgi:hypothetical protein
MTRRTLLFLAGGLLPFVAVAVLVAVGGPAVGDRLVGPVGVDRPAADRAVAGLAAGTTASQRAALSDGQATLAEYRAAVDRTVACLSGRLAAEARRRFPDGSVTVTVGRPRLSPDAFALTYDYGFRFADGFDVAAQPASLADVPARIDGACQDEHLVDVQAAYQVGRLADPAYVRSVDAGFRSCLSDAGLTVRAGDDAHEALAGLASGAGLPPAAVACVGRFPAVTGAPAG